MSVRCNRCPAEAENLPALAAHVREVHGSAAPARPAGAEVVRREKVPQASELRSVMTDGREGSVARDTGAGFEDTGEREACEVCGRLDLLRPVARSTWSLDPHRRTALVCPACAGAEAAGG